MGTINVRVFTSHPVIRAHYNRVLSAEHDFLLAEENDPLQVGVFDGEIGSFEVILTLARPKYPAMRPLLVSATSDNEACLRWLFRGIYGWVPCEHYEDQLANAVRHVAAGGFWFPRAVIAHWMQIAPSLSAPSLPLPLTGREREVLGLLLRRLSNKEIAGILGITDRTVKFHVGNVLNKFKVRSRGELAVSWMTAFHTA